MKGKKLADVLFTAGICVVVAGVLGGVAAGLINADKFNFLPACIVWLLSIISGTGMVTVSGSLSEAKEKTKDDAELLKEILNKIKNDEESQG